MTNVLLIDLGLSIPPKFFFESFIDKCVSNSVDLTNYLLTETFHLPLLFELRPWSDPGIESFGNVKQAACLVCRKP